MHDRRARPRSRAQRPDPGSARLEITTAISASERPCGNRSGDRYEVRAAAGKQNPERLHIVRHTRVLPRLDERLRRCDTRARRACSSIFAALRQSCAATITRIMPMPRLNVRRQSSSGMLPILRSSSKIGSTGQEPVSISNAQALGQNARSVVGDAAAGDVRRALEQSRVIAAREAASDSCDAASAVRRR